MNTDVIEPETIETTVINTENMPLTELPDGYTPGTKNLSFNSAIG